MSGNGGNLVGVIDGLEAVVVITRTHDNQGRDARPDEAPARRAHPPRPVPHLMRG
jgi:hypothetical protein